MRLQIRYTSEAQKKGWNFLSKKGTHLTSSRLNPTPTLMHVSRNAAKPTAKTRAAFLSRARAIQPFCRWFQIVTFKFPAARHDQTNEISRPFGSTQFNHL
jgi:hypothetical protein